MSEPEAPEAHDALGDTAAATPESTPSPAPIVRPGARAALAAGSTVGRYVVAEHLGAGGMGSVYRARDPELGRDLAIKVLHPHLADQRARLLREGQAIARLVHPNVVTIHDVGAHGDGLFIAMEYIAGTDLRRWLSVAKRSPAAILDTFVLAGRGLVAAHAARLVHRDFKPDNVLVGTDGRVIVTDFGLARADATEVAPVAIDGAGGIELTRTGAFTGTPLYMSPEQFTGARVEAASDQFSFCVALYEALYGVRPFAGTTLETIAIAVTEGKPAAPPEVAGVSAAVRAAIMRGLAREPAARHRSMAALVDALVVAPARPRRRLFVGLGALAIAGGVAAVAAWPRDRAVVPAAIDPCAQAVARIDAIRVPPIDQPALAAFAARWRTARTAACGSERDAACLDRAADLLAERVRTPGDTWLPLPPLEHCGTPPEVVDLHESLAGVALIAASPDATRFTLENLSPRHEVVETASGRRTAFELPGDWHVVGWPDPGHLMLQSRQRIARYDLASAKIANEHDVFDGTIAATLALDTVTGLVVANDRYEVHRTGAPDVPLAITSDLAGPVFTVDGDRLAWIATDAGGASSLAIFDETTRATTTIPLRHTSVRGYGLAWIGTHRLVVVAEIGKPLGSAIWQLRDDVRGAFVQPPELIRPAVPGARLDSPTGTADGHVFAIERHASHSTGRITGGKFVVVPRTEDLELEAATRDGKTLLLASTDHLQARSIADDSTTALGDVTALAHGDAIVTLHRCGDEICIEERETIASAPTPVARVPHTAAITCSAAGCATWASPTDTSLVVTPVIPAGPTVTITATTFLAGADLAISPNGKRFAVLTRDLVGVAAPGAAVVALPIDDNCHAIAIVWRDDASVIATEACQLHQRVVVLHDDRPPERIYETDGTIQRVSVTADAIYATVGSHIDRLVELDLR